MADDIKLNSNIDDKLFSVKYTCDTQCHLNPNQEKCIKCKSKACTYVCPANVYAWRAEDKTLLVRYENCLECGACRIACEKKCIDWRYPRAGFGVSFKQG
ncbi:MAG: 4Fe-4S dicluster domain-containing protein [Candidatus Gastranaerophilales bacterium]|nr:4Fe-4S dicluster domain-containing protein [Candidatus Gastranaerophilales bacterium]